MKRFQPLICLLLIVIATSSVVAQNQRTSEAMAGTVLEIWKDSMSDTGRADKWNYEQGVLLEGMESVWLSTGDARYFKHIQHLTDRYVNDDGTIRTYRKDEYNIDNILPGRNLLLLYKVTGQEKYRKAAALLREQLQTHPRTSDGGFWHKKIYPYQMWLDGLYMGGPFYTEYAATFHEDAAFNDIAKQFILMETHSRDSKTGLLYHGWDESKKQRWANPTTGRSPNFWGRAMGWYAMALVDTLDHFPANHPERPKLIAILQRLAAAVEKYQDPQSGLWYDVLDKAGHKGNYFESSAASMFVYALAKGVRVGYLAPKYLRVARKGYQGIQKQFIETKPNGNVNLTGTVSVSGLGGNPYRDGSYEYYLSEKVVTNDPKGVGAFLSAASEMEMLPDLSLGSGKTVLLDSYFNNEMKKDATGRMVSWHYKWDELPNGGYSLWGNIFRSFGAETKTLADAPTPASLKNADIYIIVDPDTKTENEQAKFIEATHVKSISDWVKSGGVLVLMGNDVGNSEFDQFNELAKQFGVHFKKDSRNRVQNDKFETGRIVVPGGNPIFTSGLKLFLKELSTLSVAPPARVVLEEGGDAIMAVAKVGKGTVFALGDPWLYNEYVDGRKLPAEYENFKAAKDLSRWLILQSRSRARRN